ncbi:hypothetical protein [Kineococcus radiotolerans]|uniref:Uncharacterized protein n=1 Tax=Kineococcus radiotolerans (strain ATCC BAA-149 / DSM 14245 / SRS30216) TaxID=266940 RepID=A6W8R8_KINRD|nr:hypothetical protein [Kineococcus radiotolerans]ABS03207.1 hypothetical protein Krad_1721 [Kineococcus radiotolerans SRS30216 = ATCC BAA-149]
MAVSEEGQELTEQHRLQQVAIGALVALEVAQSMRLLDPLRLPGTADGWVRAVARLITARRRQSWRAAVRYYEAFRAAELDALADIDIDPGERPRPRRPATAADEDLPEFLRDDVDDVLETPSTGSLWRPPAEPDWAAREQAMVTSLMVTGPVGVRRRIERGEEAPRALEVAGVEVAGAASRQTLYGGRKAMLELVREDRAALGYIRVTDFQPCYFCAMLASRGPVYKSDSFAESDPRFEGAGKQKVHDHCGCTIESVYSVRTGWPGRGKDYQDLWYEATTPRTSPEQMRRDFRRAYEAQIRDLLKQQRDGTTNSPAPEADVA